MSDTEAPKSSELSSSEPNSSEVSSPELPLGQDWITSVLPHRYPMLLVDRVVEVDPGKSIVAIKNVTRNEPFFDGHFPQFPIMPGVLVVEALAQAAGLLMMYDLPALRGRVIYFTGIERARFRRPITPGDQLRLEVELLRHRRYHAKFACKARVDGEVAVEAVASSMLASEHQD